MAEKEHMLIHRVPVFEDGSVARMRYFRTVTEAKDFAKEQCKALGHGGYTVDSLPAKEVVRLLEELAPIPEWYLTRKR